VTVAPPGRVRRAEPRDLEAVTGLWLAIGAHHAGLGPAFALRADARPEARALLRALLRDPDAAAFLYEEDGRAQGLCLVRIDRAPPIGVEAARAEISDLGVAPERRRRGIGRLLVSRARAWIHERGVRRVEVRVAVRNAEGQAFWRALGFADLVDVLELHL
jgi:ribosomal protein S18 acetylase RimI-like enzyme